MVPWIALLIANPANPCHKRWKGSGQQTQQTDPSPPTKYSDRQLHHRYITTLVSHWLGSIELDPAFGDGT